MADASKDQYVDSSPDQEHVAHSRCPTKAVQKSIFSVPAARIWIGSGLKHWEIPREGCLPSTAAETPEVVLRNRHQLKKPLQHPIPLSSSTMM
ncbi:hypothetical protein DSO57_1037749 [Entomophthora muscae]|uniref:Uncharacterized protein n=1 Tax=Entomophthora muscae TaxID=34485 RepID=A0ACC2SMU8_9FUNG|nr:hypothetical protein DSO57_1037749 [Entomophthora muscae]